MKVLIVNGSPRLKGNSAEIAENLLKKYHEKGDNAKIVHLNCISMKGCQGCLSCRKNDSFCVVRDELGGMLPEFLEYDLFIIISPNYYGLVTGQMKIFLDRWYCFKTSDRRTKFNEGKKVFFIFTQGSPNRDHGKSVIDWGKYFFEGFGLKYYGYILPNCNVDNTDMVRVKLPDIYMNLNMFA
ncbi:MAG: flavodoxin family protein [Calditerrivibrio sp.]|nr:flavodoxin family protein [Calditerrivibrio sp.]